MPEWHANCTVDHIKAAELNPCSTLGRIGLQVRDQKAECRSMRQKNTKQMLNYWMELYWQSGNLPGTAPKLNWPSRNDIQPSDCRSILGNMFILERVNGLLSYRLAGTQLCGLYGRELKREVFSDVFVVDDRMSAENWVQRLGLDDYILLMSSHGETASGDFIPIETLLLPLVHEGAPGERLLGITTPCDAPHWLGVTPVAHQHIRSIRVLRPWETAQPGTPTVNETPPTRDLPSRRRDFHAPSMFAGMSSMGAEIGNPTAARREKWVGHLRVIDGGLSGHRSE